MAKILICDDEKDIVSALAIYLQAEGYETVPAHNGREALQVLREEDEDAYMLGEVVASDEGVILW